MGLCFSGHNVQGDSDCSSSGARTVKVITVSGDLREFRAPVTAAQVLRSGSSSSSSSSSVPSGFVCDSDRLYYDEFIQALDLEEELVGGQIYFVLPRSRLQQPLTASEMAGLAVKASLALQKADEKGGTRRRRRRKTRISPALHVNSEEFKVARAGEDVQANVKMVSRGRLGRRCPSRRLRNAVQSFRIRLSTIHEGVVYVDPDDF
ncbi:hypothetical protein MLD38_022140 [Melastoma candidum]|uniref:Uncharacterized protein n=1 Tax=Melastoma candidum TaxID=119954 RepID=A0ACB9QHJ2_9MYRT|nr:hypothetical protein MLD38_022140 [Melastoma candidum]